MDLARLIKDYVLWHYQEGLREIETFWGNIVWFTSHFFSMGLLVRTLFRPLYRMHQSYGDKGLDLQFILESFILNTISRLVGFFMRITVLTIGGTAELIFFILAPLSFLLWLTLPLLAPALFFTGLLFIIFF